METGTLENKIAALPDELKLKVEGFVDSLLNDGEKLINKENKTSNGKADKPKGQFGDLKGFVKYIADDFDAPMEEFKDYM